MIDLAIDDIEDEIPLTKLTDQLSAEDLRESRDYYISVQYNLLDFSETPYNFNQPFVGNEANLYFQRMKDFSQQTINDLIDNSDYTLHFHRSAIRGNLKQVFDRIDPNISKADPLIYHFALDPNCKTTNASRKTGIRNPRIYFMLGYSGTIHILFFDPYHEINPI